jgi:hypothetical protein
MMSIRPDTSRSVGIQLMTQLAPQVYRGVRFIRTHLPPLQPRRFPWLQAIEGVS